MDFDLSETIGIDFGTSYSTVSKYENGKVELVQDEFFHKCIPSYISYVNNDFIYGHQAYLNACSYTGKTVYEFKRLIGHSYGDEVISKCVKQMPYEIVDDNHGGVQIEIQDGDTKHQYSISSLISRFVSFLIKKAELSLDHPVKNCIITVPSYFNSKQRNIILSAVKETGIRVLTILTEPTAAALAYSSINNYYIGNTKTMIVYDFGGGTFDVSIIQGSYGTFDVLATSGDTEVGGRDITAVVSDYLQEELKKYPEYANYCTSKKGLEIIRNEAERMKKELTYNSSTETFIMSGDDGIKITLERAEFEKRITSLVQRTIDVVQECVRFVKMNPENMEIIILIGGSSYIPLIKSMLGEAFPSSKILDTIDTRLAVATGALHYACIRKQGNELRENSSNTVVLKNPGEFFSAASLLKEQTDAKTVVVNGETYTLQPPMLPPEYEASCTPYDSAVALIEETLNKYPQCPPSLSIYDVLEQAGLSVDATLNVNRITSYDIVNHALTQSTIAERLQEVEQKEYAFSKQQTVFTDVTPLSIGYVNSKGRYHELIKRNTPLPVNSGFTFSCEYNKNMTLSLTIADSRNPASGKFDIIGCTRLDNVPPPANSKLDVTVRIKIDRYYRMTVSLTEQQSGVQQVFYFNKLYENEVVDETNYREQFNNQLLEKMKLMSDFVKRTGNADCKVTLSEMKEVMRRKDEFTVDQLKEIMEKIHTILRLYNIK